MSKKPHKTQRRVGSKEVTLTIPLDVSIPFGSDKDAEWHTVSLDKMSNDVLQKALVNGFVKALGDISRGWATTPNEKENIKGVPNTDDAWSGLRDARIDSWYRGDWASRERGDNNTSLVKDQYYFEQMSERGLSTKKIDAEIKQLVETVLGDEAKATFANWMIAAATMILTDGDKKPEASAVAEFAAKIESELLERATERAKTQVETADKLEVPAGLAAFMKPKA